MDQVTKELTKSLKKHRRDLKELGTVLESIEDKESFTFTHLSGKHEAILATVIAIENLLGAEDGEG